MFEFVRDNTRWLMGGLLVLLAVAFIVPQGYSSFVESGGGPVAEVDSRKITQIEWDAEHRRQSDRLRQSSPQADPSVFDSPAAKRQVLENLVEQRALLAAARRQHLEADDARVRALFEAEPQLAQALRTADGKLNRALLSAQGMSEAGFVNELREDIQRRQVLAPVQQPVWPKEGGTRAADLLREALLQQRELRWQRFLSADYVAQVTFKPEELEAHYRRAEVQQRWRRAESARIDYLVLDAQALKAGVSVAEDELKAAYDSAKSRFSTPQERRVAHLLLRTDGKDNEATVRQRLLGWRAQAGSDAGFAALARQHSQDEGSVGAGGDLGFVTREGLPKAFADAAFALARGTTSEVVQTEQGLHLIRVLEVRGGDVRPFEAVRAELEDELRSSKARKAFQLKAETFSNLVFEQAGSLKAASDKLGLPIQSAQIQRKPVPGAVGPLTSAKLLEAVFSAESVRTKQNTEAIETAPQQLVSARVVEHQAATAPPLAEVREAVQAEFVRERAVALAKAAGERRLKEGGEAGLEPPRWVSRAQPEGLPRAVLEAALRASTAKLPMLVGQDAGNEGYWVLQLRKTDKPSDAVFPPNEVARMHAQQLAQLEAQAFVEVLKQRARAKVHAPAVPAASAP